MKKLSVIDLFAGIGGFSLGLHRTGGFDTVKFCEMKPHAQAVLAKNFPGIPCHDDVTTYDFKEGEADVITAGFPCQDISFAGDGAGLAGARSGLYREVIRALRLVRPLYAILENVAALLGRGLDVVLGDMAEVGYDAEWHCIPASAVGAPHRRDRIWIIAHSGSDEHEGHRAPLSGTLAAELLNANATLDGRGEGLARLGYGRQAMADAQCGAGKAQHQRCLLAEPLGEGPASRLADGYVSGNRQWAVEPNVGRVAHGVSMRVDRLAELGNAVVPQIPEIIGNAILASLHSEAA